MEKDRISEFLESIDSEKWNCVYQANGMTLLTTKEYNYRYEERINLQTQLKKQLEVGEQQYNDLVEETEKLKERISYLERSIERKEETITELELERVPYTNEYVEKVKKENEDLKRQLEYLRSGEYLNQLKFERNMLEDVVSNGEVSKEDKEFIDCTHRNTELLEENQKYKEVIDKAIEYIKQLDELERKIDDYAISKYVRKELLDILKEVE